MRINSYRPNAFILAPNKHTISARLFATIMNAEHGESTRREFLKKSGTAVAAASMGLGLASPRAGYAAERNNIKVALVGCGGRGTGAIANALATTGPVQLWAVADVFGERAESSLNTLKRQYSSQVDVPNERKFVGFDAFKKAIDSLDKGDVVVLATPPAFRPMHLEYAVQKGVHVFMEKSFGSMRRAFGGSSRQEKLPRKRT